MSFNTGFEKFHSFCASTNEISNKKLEVLATNEETKELHKFIKSIRDVMKGNFQTDVELVCAREHERSHHSP